MSDTEDYSDSYVPSDVSDFDEDIIKGGQDEDEDEDNEEIEEEEAIEVIDEDEDITHRPSVIKTSTNKTFVREVTIVPANKRKTSNILTAFELTEVLSVRSIQISKTGRAFVDIGGINNAIDIAKKELKEGQCPLRLVRKFPVVIDQNGEPYQEAEIWNPNTMAKPSFI
jgi:DNA-directed RNA polymerase subunit K/omega